MPAKGFVFWWKPEYINKLKFEIQQFQWSTFNIFCLHVRYFLRRFSEKNGCLFDYLTMFNAFFALGYIVVPVLLYHYSIPGLYQNRLGNFSIKCFGLPVYDGGPGLGVGEISLVWDETCECAQVCVKVFSIYYVDSCCLHNWQRRSRRSCWNLNGALVRYGYEDVVESPVDLLKLVIFFGGNYRCIYCSQCFCPCDARTTTRKYGFIILLCCPFTPYFFCLWAAEGLLQIF